MELTPAAEKFILHWGEMGTRWGINRTVAQIHALLYISPEPLNAEQIAQVLSVARSNVSTSLKELQTFNIVRVTHVLGDRRDHFETKTDVWDMFRCVLDERKRREIDPTLDMLRECMTQTNTGRKADEHVRRRLEALVDFFESVDGWYSQLRKLPSSGMAKFVKAGGRMIKVLGIN